MLFLTARTGLDERHDRVADDLAGPMEGDVATAVHPQQLGANRRRVDEHVRLVGVHPERVRRRVFEQQQVVARRPLEQRALQGEPLAVGNPAEPPDVKRQLALRALRTSRGSR